MLLVTRLQEQEGVSVEVGDKSAMEMFDVRGERRQGVRAWHVVRIFLQRFHFYSL